MLFRWLRTWLTDASVKTATRAGYKSGYEKGKSEGETTAQTIVANARDEAVKIVKQSHIQITTLEVSAQRRGYKRGHAEGLRKGAEDATVTALEDAQRQALVHYGIVVPPEEPVEIISEEDFRQLVFTVDQYRPNIYEYPHCWTVRVIIDGERRSEVFPISCNYNIRNSLEHKRAKADALVHAIRYRNSLTNNFREYWALWCDCLTDVNRNPEFENLSARQLTYHAVLEFYHRRKYSTGTELHSEVPGWFGDDPEDRLDIENKRLLDMPWPTLFESVSSRLSFTFSALGLGYKHNPRTVRDLLLVAPEELLAVINFGPVSLESLRAGLSAYGLALWGDAVPATPTTRRPGEREFRRIILGDDDAG